MASAEYDIRFYREGLTTLERYLLSDDLYWPSPATPPHGEPPYQALTLGSLLLAQKRLSVLSLNKEEQSEVAKLQKIQSELKVHWRTAWEKKAAHEIRSRLNQWQNFIADYREMPAAHADGIVTEARSRTMIDLLLAEIHDRATHSEYEKAVTGLDAGLKPFWHKGSFIWAPELASQFPPNSFWYLYGRLDSKEPE